MSRNPDIIAAVERNVTAEAATAREIWQRVDCWAPWTIRNTLEHLRKDGRIVGVVELIPSGFTRKYVRAA